MGTASKKKHCQKRHNNIICTENTKCDNNDSVKRHSNACTLQEIIKTSLKKVPAWSLRKETVKIMKSLTSRFMIEHLKKTNSDQVLKLSNTIVGIV